MKLEEKEIKIKNIDSFILTRLCLSDDETIEKIEKMCLCERVKTLDLIKNIIKEISLNLENELKASEDENAN